MSRPVERRATEQLLRLIADGTAPVVGEEFFRSLVRRLAEAVGVKYAFVAGSPGSKHASGPLPSGLARTFLRTSNTISRARRVRWC